MSKQRCFPNKVEFAEEVLQTKRAFISEATTFFEKPG